MTNTEKRPVVAGWSRSRWVPLSVILPVGVIQRLIERNLSVVGDGSYIR